MSAQPRTAYHASNIARNETLGAIADALLILNWCICNEDGLFYFEEHRKRWPTPLYLLRKMQTQLLERYREEMNMPYERFYVSAEIGGGNGHEAKAKAVGR